MFDGHDVTSLNGVWGGPTHLSKHYDKSMLAAVVTYSRYFLIFGYIFESYYF